MKTQIKWGLIGASRGLGQSFAWQVARHRPEDQILIVSRRADTTQLPRCELYACDLNTEQGQVQLIEQLQTWQPQRLFYFAGGGPYGSYQSKAWKDHQWAWQVSFMAAARVLHTIDRAEQMVFIGSAIAENQPDPHAASYAAAKHALKGLVTTLQVENPKRDLRLYSPGYMDTGLLPPRAVARQQVLLKPEVVAADLYEWCNSVEDRNGQRSFAN
jgi:short-subunit dehydrogenase